MTGNWFLRENFKAHLCMNIDFHLACLGIKNQNLLFFIDNINLVDVKQIYVVNAINFNTCVLKYSLSMVCGYNFLCHFSPFLNECDMICFKCTNTSMWCTRKQKIIIK